MCWLACLDILINTANVQNNSSGSHAGEEADPYTRFSSGGTAREFHNVFNVRFKAALDHKSSGSAFKKSTCLATVKALMVVVTI